MFVHIKEKLLNRTKLISCCCHSRVLYKVSICVCVCVCVCALPPHTKPQQEFYFTAVLPQETLEDKCSLKKPNFSAVNMTFSVFRCLSDAHSSRGWKHTQNTFFKRREEFVSSPEVSETSRWDKHQLGHQLEMWDAVVRISCQSFSHILIDRLMFSVAGIVKTFTFWKICSSISEPNCQMPVMSMTVVVQKQTIVSASPVLHTFVLCLPLI